MQSLVELWALLALFLSKILDQVGCGEWSADVGLFNFGGREQGERCVMSGTGENGTNNEKQ